jgi:hypothetical protein
MIGNKGISWAWIIPLAVIGLAYFGKIQAEKQQRDFAEGFARGLARPQSPEIPLRSSTMTDDKEHSGFTVGTENRIQTPAPSDWELIGEQFEPKWEPRGRIGLTIWVVMWIIALAFKYWPVTVAATVAYALFLLLAGANPKAEKNRRLEQSRPNTDGESHDVRCPSCHRVNVIAAVNVGAAIRCLHCQTEFEANCTA